MILKSGPLPNTTHECPCRGVMGEGRATYKRRWKEDMMYTCRSVMSPLQMMNKTRHDITSQCNSMYMLTVCCILGEYSNAIPYSIVHLPCLIAIHLRVQYFPPPVPPPPSVVVCWGPEYSRQYGGSWEVASLHWSTVYSIATYNIIIDCQWVKIARACDQHVNYHLA